MATREKPTLSNKDPMQPKKKKKKKKHLGFKIIERTKEVISRKVLRIPLDTQSMLKKTSCYYCDLPALTLKQTPYSFIFFSRF